MLVPERGEPTMKTGGRQGKELAGIGSGREETGQVLTFPRLKQAERQAAAGCDRD